MTKPRIFLGSSGQQSKLLEALTRGLQDVAEVEPWTSVFNPGVSTLDRLAGLFGGALGMRRTFILHARGAKAPA